MSKQRFEVCQRRYGDKIEIWIIDHLRRRSVHVSIKAGWSANGIGAHEVSLRTHWWTLTSPAEKVRRITAKAHRKADKLNHREMYLSHEAELAKRES